ncbi:hypothetical protein HYT18_04670 [Candidatus Microgenomates bacterium]|nr:hypothetical protein [Candidatus Microgenomates bacterium]
MAKLSINLLPPEFNAEQVKKTKFYKIQAAGVAAILVMSFLASISVALRILQSQNIRQVQAQVSQEEQRIDGLKNRQASLLILKNRLTAINRYLGVSSQQSVIFNLIDQLLPSSVSVTSLTVDRSGGVLISAVIPDSLTLDETIAALISEDANQGKISRVEIESLNRGRDGIFRLSIKVKPKT